MSGCYGSGQEDRYFEKRGDEFFDKQSTFSLKDEIEELKLEIEELERINEDLLSEIEILKEVRR